MNQFQLPTTRSGISVKRYRILKMSFKILHNTNFPKIAKQVPEAKNYRTTKKKVLDFAM